MPAVSRDAVDRAVIDGTPLVDVPGGHGRPSVVVPRDEMALALRLHLASFRKHAAGYYKRHDISEGAIRSFGAAICRALNEEPLPSAELRKVVNRPGAGELWVAALMDLTARGIIRRFPIDGRLDSTKYKYELLHPDDRPQLDAEGDDAVVLGKAVERFLRWSGPATVDEISGWGDFTKTAVKQALSSIGAEAVSVPGWTREAWLMADAAEEWRSFKDTDEEHTVLLPYRDPFVDARRPPAVLARNSDVPVLYGSYGGPKRMRLGDAEGLTHHTIASGGELVGIWDYDPDTQAIVTRLWIRDKALRHRVEETAAETERFIRQQLGDVKLSAVDPPARRAVRLAFCRAAP
jgi:hypothetical protein